MLSEVVSRCSWDLCQQICEGLFRHHRSSNCWWLVGVVGRNRQQPANGSDGLHAKGLAHVERVNLEATGAFERAGPYFSSVDPSIFPTPYCKAGTEYVYSEGSQRLLT